MRESNTPFEVDLVRVLENIALHHPNLHLRSWTKLPYVSSGDVRRTHYTIDMALMVFSLNESSAMLAHGMPEPQPTVG